MYNQINGIDAVTINSNQNKYFSNKFLTLTENKNYEKKANIGDYHFNAYECDLNEDQYDYICILKELNDLGVEFVSHKNINNYFSMLDDISEYELILKYKGKQKIAIPSYSGNLRSIYFFNFRIIDTLTCNI